MTKESGLLRALAGVAIVGVVFNCIYLLVPFIRWGVFWTCYAWSWVALAAFALANVYLAKSSRSPTSALYRVGIVAVGFAYLFVAEAANLAFAAWFPFAFGWAVTLTNVVLLALYALAFVGGDTGATLVEEADSRQAMQTAAISMLRERAAMARAAARPQAAYAAELDALIDDLRYSDPVSNQSSIPLEHQLSDMMTQLAHLIDTNDQQGALECCRNIRAVLRQRNVACRMGK